MKTCRLHVYFILLLVISCVATGCSRDEITPRFEKLSPEQTGIRFVNTITSAEDMHVQNYPYLYNGGGVAVGDINGNGLPDIYLTGNQVTSRLYLNKGNMQFEDITESAGVSTSRWAAGASMADINGNGLLDIYVSVAGPSHIPAEERANLLFINNGDATFTEAAAEYNLADTSFTTHAAFLDFDGDGYLDVYLLNNSEADFAHGAIFARGEFRKGSSISFDKLYRNNGNGTFSDLSREAGLLEEIGYGLGVAVADLNRNGWPDIYISNDLESNDVLYLNNGDGTFTDKSDVWLKHTSLAGMGVDIADFNNNGWPDILQADMMPENLRERKRMSGSATYDQQMELINRGVQYQYSVNTLQMNSGMQPNGDLVFSEIARQAGVAYTDWSWAGLFADFNNSGLKDILITTGFPKAVYDFDYKIREFSLMNTPDSDASRQLFELVNDLHSIEIPNYLFRNDGNLGFINETARWGLDEAGFSYGAAYADLNNNGRLDLVINNINAPASVYKNTGNNSEPEHYLQVQLSGEYPNTRGIGSEVVLKTGGVKQYIYQSPYRGYQSTVEDRIHFGLGDESHIDSLEVYWPDGRYQLLTNLSANRLITIEQRHTAEYKQKHEGGNLRRQFARAYGDQAIQWKHYENDSFIDFNVQPQLPYRLSRLGPVLATADVTGNGLDDVYVGGAAGSAGVLFLQQESGQFVVSADQQPWENDRDYKDTGALFFDANGNGLPDLYVASGGYDISPSSQLQQDRLYINQGDGSFIKKENALPEMLTASQTIAAGDFTGNGLMDLFVGGRLVPYNYPLPPRSYLLRNDGGTFTDITANAAPELLGPGMITGAVWVDFNGNGRQDLVTAGIWLPIQFYENMGEQLIAADTGLPHTRGWWYSLAAGDFNNNGHIDLVAGNLGLNHTFTTSPENPFGVYAADFNNNRQVDIFFTKRDNGRDYPFFGLAKYGLQHNHFMRRFRWFEKFADADMQELYTSGELDNAIRYQADSFASVFLQNNGDGTFTSACLPALAQISPVKSILVHDADGDGNLDLILAGNIYASDPEIPRSDAGNGLWLKGDGMGNFIPVPPVDSGFFAPKDVKALALVQTPGGYSILAGNNNDSLSVFSIRP